MNKHSKETGNIECPRHKTKTNTTQYVLDTTIRNQTQMTYIRHEVSHGDQIKW